MRSVGVGARSPIKPLKFEQSLVGPQFAFITVAITASITGKASTTSAITGSGTLVSLIIGHATLSGTVKGSGALTGSSVGHGSETGTLKGAGVLLGSSSGHAAVGGTLKGASALSSAVAGHVTLSGALKGTGSILGVSIGRASLVATSKGTGSLLSSILGHSTDTGTLSGAGHLLGSSLGHAAISGTARGAGILSDAIAGKASISGTLNGGSSLIGGSISGFVTVSLRAPSPVPSPVTVSGTSFVPSNFGGISQSNPAIVSLSSFGSGMFYQPVTFFYPTNAALARADGWSNLGTQAAPGLLLTAPGNGLAPTDGYQVLLSGQITAPSDAIGSITVTLYQNVFTQVGSVIQHQSYPRSATSISVASGVQNWSLVKQMFSANISYLGHDKPIQLSVGVSFSGTSSVPITVKLMQFELRK